MNYNELLPRNQILQGHVLDKLRELPDKSINCVFTSPPYFGLRAYHTEPQIWENNLDCQHQWQETPPRRSRSEKDATSEIEINSVDGRNYEAKGGNICGICNAWRGELGCEPTREMYIEHLTMVTAELMRVLRDDGILFWNLGDSYATTPAGNKSPVPAKSLYHIPELFVLAMEKQGWCHHSTIIWAKAMSYAWHKCEHCGEITRYSGSCMPDSTLDRPNKNGFEYVYMFVKANKKPQFWINDRTGRTVAGKKPGADHWWRHERTGLLVNYRPIGERLMKWRAKTAPRKPLWTRFNYWKAWDFFYEQGYEPACYDGRKQTKLRGSKKYKEGRNYSSQPVQAVGRGESPERWPSRYIGVDETPQLGRVIRNVWAINLKPMKEAHFATFPPALVNKVLAIGCPRKVCSKCGLPRKRIITKNAESLCRCHAEFHPGICLDPFMGAGTVAIVAKQMGMDYVGIELNPEYIKIAEKRLNNGGIGTRIKDNEALLGTSTSEPGEYTRVAAKDGDKVSEMEICESVSGLVGE